MVYTASGARRSGDDYQDLQSAELLIAWLENPTAYRWVRLETMDGSLDDIQAMRADGTLCLQQVKFATDVNDAWDWSQLIAPRKGKAGPSSSLLQRWQSSLGKVTSAGSLIADAAFVTNRAPAQEIKECLSDGGVLEFDNVSASLRDTLSEHLGGKDVARKFFASFHFHFLQPSPDALEVGLRTRFARLGGNDAGWLSLLQRVRRWINHQNEPPPDGTITLEYVRQAALWHLPPVIPQEFTIPPDYVAPQRWSKDVVERQIRSSVHPTVVTGTPGAGKSTYLSWLVKRLRQLGVPVVRHHFFLSTTDGTARRTEWETAAEAFIGQLRASYGELVDSLQARNPAPFDLPQYLCAAGQKRAGKPPLVVIVDGLDHVWRDTGSEEGLRRLFDLLLPAPEGVCIIVGTQSVDPARLPLKLRNTCPRDKWLSVPPLDSEDVRNWLGHHRLALTGVESGRFAESISEQLVQAFHQVSGGHPLVLHFVLELLRRRGHVIRPEHVQALPEFASGSNVATYYQTLWDEIGAEGHQLLHLLAGFAWAWPHDGLVQCLSPQADSARLEIAKRAVEHVLGSVPAGVVAFHESLLAFVRARADHELVATALMPLVLSWLVSRAPRYWRWRHEAEIRAQGGEPRLLLESPTLDWCANALVAGRGVSETAKVVAASGWCALKHGDIASATTRHYLDAYLAEARSSEGVLAPLLWLALRRLPIDEREVELRLFSSRVKHADAEELAAASEIAWLVGDSVSSEAIDAEIRRRWNANRRDERQFSMLQKYVPHVIAVGLSSASEGPYQKYVATHAKAPPWCLPRHYIPALARTCAVGHSTKSARDELRFLANHRSQGWSGAADAIVRLACREGFEADPWLTNKRVRRSGLFRCYAAWRGKPEQSSTPAPRNISFARVWRDRYGSDDEAFVKLARTYFFVCAACSAEGRPPPSAAGLHPEEAKVAEFLGQLRDIAVDAGLATRSGAGVGGAWLASKLASIPRAVERTLGWRERLTRHSSIAQITVSIAQDLEALHFAATGNWSLTNAHIEELNSSNWASDRAWIADRVEQRLPMGSPDAASRLVELGKLRLRNTRDSAHLRAEEYALLAQFAMLNNLPDSETAALAHLAARNLLAHGYHKDMTLDDVLDSFRAVSDPDRGRTLARLQRVSPVIQVVGEITDGDEVRHFPRMLASLLSELVPEALPSYLQGLQRQRHSWIVESCFTDLAESMPFETPLERALGATLVHEDALAELQKRFIAGDANAGSVLSRTLAWCGRQDAPAENVFSSSPEPRVHSKRLPSFSKYPPERLLEFMKETRAALVYDDDHLARWTAHWRTRDPDGLLTALISFRESHGYPHERKSAKLVVELALERAGPAGGWDWLVTYHASMYGWNLYAHRLADIQWIWEMIRARFPDRWLEFVVATASPRWGSAAGAPSWSTERMLRYLRTVGQEARVGGCLDAAVEWASGLAADMVLPPHGLHSTQSRVPPAVRMLVDRLDCPSRMVQERAVWTLAELFAREDTREATVEALNQWHGNEALELRSCMLVLILLLARSAHGADEGAAAKAVRGVELTFSVALDALLGELGPPAMASITHQSRHSGDPGEEFLPSEHFEEIVRGHLAPCFLLWAGRIDKTGAAFTRQWAWEASKLAEKLGLSLVRNAHFDHHYRGGVQGPGLAINDDLSVALRSSFLRALQWVIDVDRLEFSVALYFAKLAGVMAEPSAWAVEAGRPPAWWPLDGGSPLLSEDIDSQLDRKIGATLKQTNLGRDEVLAYACGPVACESGLSAELEIRAFLQRSGGGEPPVHRMLSMVPPVGCYPGDARLSLPSTYAAAQTYVFRSGNWQVAPLAWELNRDTLDWLLPERQARGVHLPACWLFEHTPTLEPTRDEIRISAGRRDAARFRYWHRNLSERQHWGAFSRVGCELLVRRDSVAPQMEVGASLSWIATLRVARRDQDSNLFGPSSVVKSWLVGANT